MVIGGVSWACWKAPQCAAPPVSLKPLFKFPCSPFSPNYSSSGHILSSPEGLKTFRRVLKALFEQVVPVLKHCFPETNPASRWLYPDLDDLFSWTDDDRGRTNSKDSKYPHHCFVIRYLPGEQKSLPQHIDNSKITLNICLYDTSDTTLTFEDPLDPEQNKASRKRTTCRHTPGWAVVHLGDVWHEVTVPKPEKAVGERWNLVCWLR